jgi:hypothetical protein
VRGALHLSIRQMYGAIWPPAVAAALMAAALGGLDFWFLGKLPAIVHILVAVPAGAAIFGVVLWSVSRQSVNEMMGFARELARRDAPA